MSAKWMGYFFDESNLEGSELLIALAIADHADSEGVAFPGVELLAAKIRLQKRRTQDLIKRLEFLGFLEVARKQGRGNLSVFQLKKVQSTAPIEDDKRCNLEPIKGAIQSEKKVQSGACIYKREPLREPKKNREEEKEKNPPQKKRTEADEEVVAKTESILQTVLDLKAKLLLLEIVPPPLFALWLTYAKTRMLGMTEKNPSKAFMHGRLGFWMTDFKRDHKNEYEKFNRPNLPTLAEREAETAARQNLPRVSAAEFMRGVQQPRPNNPATGRGN